MKMFYITLIMLLQVSLVRSQFGLNLESGIVGTGYNDVQIPGKDGTRLSLKNDLKPETQLYYRIRLQYTINERHNFSLLYAPLSIESKGTLAEDVLFDNTVFPAQNEITSTYKFNSYRFTYRYDFIKRPSFDMGLGFTAKIRDAAITLESEGKKESYPNVGFVPIINFMVHWKSNEKLGILLEGDALVAPQGRAEDVLLAATYTVSKHIMFNLGYRILEGGADNNKVYTFTMFHYAALSVTITF